MVLIWLIKGVFYKKFFIIYKNEWMQFHWKCLFNLLLKKPRRDACLKLVWRRKNRKREYGKSSYRNISEERKQRLKEYQKTYCKAKKSVYNNEENDFLIVIVILIVFLIKV